MKLARPQNKDMYLECKMAYLFQGPFVLGDKCGKFFIVGAIPQRKNTPFSHVHQRKDFADQGIHLRVILKHIQYGRPSVESSK